MRVVEVACGGDEDPQREPSEAEKQSAEEFLMQRRTTTPDQPSAVKHQKFRDLLSVSTTSTLPVGAIHADIVRVLKLLELEYQETRGGFRCTAIATCSRLEENVSFWLVMPFIPTLSLQFEVLVVKVPLLRLHGIQFKKLPGCTSAYKNVAQPILKN